MLIGKNIENNTTYHMQELHLFVCSTIFNSSIVSTNFSTNLSTNVFLHLQFSQSKYSPKSHDLSYSHSQLLGIQICPLSDAPLSINSLHSHMHLSSFQRCLLLKTLASSLHLQLHVSCHFMCLISLVLDIRLNPLTFKFFTTSRTQIFAYGLLILLQLPLHLLILILKGENTGLSLLTLTISGLALNFLLFIEIQLRKVALSGFKCDTTVNPVGNIF